jgi:hypothetical protein
MMLIVSLSGALLAALVALRVLVLPWLVMGPQALDQFLTRTEYKVAAMALVAASAVCVALPFWTPADVPSHDTTRGWAVRV